MVPSIFHTSLSGIPTYDLVQPLCEAAPTALLHRDADRDSNIGIPAVVQVIAVVDVDDVNVVVGVSIPQDSGHGSTAGSPETNRSPRVSVLFLPSTRPTPGRRRSSTTATGAVCGVVARCATAAAPSSNTATACRSTSPRILPAELRSGKRSLPVWI
jgi:hypothetical protein